MSALAYLHELGIAHRDVKLDNIVLLRQEGGQDHSWDIRLIDFGLARKLSTRRVKDKAKVGTYTHMAPEVLRGVYSTKCDLWSAGIVLCGLTTGCNPFKKSTKERTFENILKSNLKFEGQHWKTVSVVLKDLLLRLLAKDMNRRISASEALNHPFLRSTR
jgi:serine/threonine protein kinase